MPLFYCVYDVGSCFGDRAGTILPKVISSCNMWFLFVLYRATKHAFVARYISDDDLYYGGFADRARCSSNV